MLAPLRADPPHEVWVSGRLACPRSNQGVWRLWNGVLMRSKFMVSFSVEMEISHADGLNHSPNSGIPDIIMVELSDYDFDAVSDGVSTLKSCSGSDVLVW